MGKLSAKGVTSLLKNKVAGRHGDGEGLQLFIDKKGRAYWLLRARIGGKDIERSLGKGDEIGLADAREKAEALRETLTAPDAANALGSRSRPRTFLDLAMERYEKKVLPRNKHEANAKAWLASLKHYCKDFLNKPVADVNKADVEAALLEVWNKKPAAAKRLLSAIRGTLVLAEAHGLRSAPFGWEALFEIMPDREAHEVRHMPSMPYADIPRFLRDVEMFSNSRPIVRAAFPFLIATTVRPGNVLSARWEHIDLEAKLWSIPKELMKRGKAHRVPLSEMAMRALAIAKQLRQEGNDLVFPSFTGEMLNEDTLRMAMRTLAKRRNSKIYVPHGFRTSFKVWSLEREYPNHLSELQLAHEIVNESERAYARGELLDLRREMLEAYSQEMSAPYFD